ncbi:hypothetical protein [Streptomyces mirabilis]|uniref:hypothetical protein n=1 Tax=Streptomyces mirabilis TaxID=68239 RepID=UPI00382A7291
MKTVTSVTAPAPSSTHDVPHSPLSGDHKTPAVAAAIPSTNSAPPQAPAVAAADSTWGIPNTIFGALVGVAGTTLLFTVGRRLTRKDRAQDHQREDDREQRIAARGVWQDLHDTIRTATSNVRSLCLDISEHPLCQDDNEAQPIPALVRQIHLALGDPRCLRSHELVADLTALAQCLTNLRTTLLPPRASLTDPSNTGHIDVLHIAAQSAKQTRIAIELENLARKTLTTLDTEWGSQPPAGIRLQATG